MEARPRSWWQTIRRLLAVVGIIVACVLGIALIVGIIGEYLFHWNWTGFNGNNKSGKTLWDWMQLLFIPVVLAVAGFWFNHRERKAAELPAEIEQKAAEQRAKAEREISEDNQREASLQAYINEMSEPLLHENLRESDQQKEVL